MKRALSQEEYIVRLNESLKQHPGFREGMEFVPFPEGAKGPEITGYLWKNRTPENRSVFAEVSQAVYMDYQIDHSAEE